MSKKLGELFRRSRISEIWNEISGDYFNLKKDIEIGKYVLCLLTAGLGDCDRDWSVREAGDSPVVTSSSSACLLSLTTTADNKLSLGPLFMYLP